ncbi:MAG: PIN domain-containing protein [bacterium]
MTKEIALDTSIVVQIFRNDPIVKSRFQTIETVYLPIPVIAEVHIGFLSRKSSQAAQRAREDFEVFASKGRLIGCTREVALKYADIEFSLRQKGLLIPQNDIWIAACCIVADQPLATRDPHFQRVSDLRVEMW